VVSDLRTHGHEYLDYPDDEDLDDDADYAPLGPPRWRPVAVMAGGVLLAAVVATAVILHSDNAGSTAAVVGPPPSRTAIATPGPTTPATSLPPETVTTLTPRAVPPTQPNQPTQPTQPIQPSTVPPAPAAPQAAAPAPVNPRTVVYTVTGTKRAFDLVSVVYTDAQGMPRTDINVALPWTKTVVLNPNTTVRSVTATSLFARLNCTIVDAAGQPVAVSANNAMIATCTG
jgi:hypothetical protein